jgi:chitin synthase
MITNQITNRIGIVRVLVEQRLQTSLTGDKRAFLDRQIDQELANM